MISRFLRCTLARLATLGLLVTLLHCGGGGGGGGSSPSPAPTPAPTAYSVTVTVGAGTTATPLTQQVQSGQTATLTVGLLSGYNTLVVTGGGGTLNGNTYTTGPITSNTTITTSATPNTVYYTVTANVGTGTTATPLTQQVQSGQTATLAVGLLSGYNTLVVTGGGGTLNGNTYTTGPITANTTITTSATANPVIHTITLVTGPGVHTPSSTVTANHGSNASISFTLDANYTNLVVTGGSGTLTGLTYALTNVTADVTLNASATAPVVTHTVTINVGTGVHTPSSSVIVNHGSNASIPFTLDAGYTNLVVTGGNGTLTGLNYALTNVTADVMLNASATAPVVTHTVTINVGTGVHTPSSSVIVNHGSNASIPFTLDAGYTNLVVTGGNGTLTGLNYALTNVTADVTLNASATAPIVSHSITINYGVSGVHGPASPLSVNDSGNVTIPFTMDPGWTNFTVNGVAAPLSYVLTNVKADLVLNVSATAPGLTHTVTINAGPGIHVPSTTLTINDGSTVQFIFTLDIGYRDPVATGLGSNCYLISRRDYNCYSDPIHQDGVISLSASVDDRYALQYIRSSDNVLFTAEFNTKPITIEARAAGKNFTMYAEYSAAAFNTLPYAIVKEQLYDDGTHGDKVAGDGVYTATFTLTPPPTTLYHDHTAQWMRLDVFAYDSGGNKVTSIIDMATNINIGVIDPSQTVGSSLVATNVYASTNSVNVVVPTLSDGTYYTKAIAQTLYGIYPDAFDVIAMVYVGNTRANNGFIGNWPHTDLIKITESGLGIATQDVSAEYGSAGKLQSVISLDNDIIGFSFLHEFSHRWAFFLNDPSLKLTDSSGVHVASPTTLVGQQTSGYYLSEQAGGDFLVTYAPDGGFNLGNKYSDWELYLMGYKSPAVVGPERFVLNPAIPQSNGTIIPRANTDLIPISGPSGSQSIEGIYGVRTPEAAISQHNFKVLFVAVSDRPLTLAETSMINRNAVYYGSQIEGRDILFDWMPNFRTMPTFWSATNYMGTMDTTVPAPK